MANQEEEAFYQELLHDFRSEATEHLEAISQGLLALEGEQEKGNQQSQIEIIFRATHSLKGAARAVNLMQIEKLSSQLESVFHCIKSGTQDYSGSMHEVLFYCLDILGILIQELGSPGSSVSDEDIRMACQELDRIGATKSAQPQPLNSTDQQPDKIASPDTGSWKAGHAEDVTEEDSPHSATSAKTSETVLKESAHQTIRIPLQKIHDLLLQTEELLNIKGRLKHQQWMTEQTIQLLDAVQRNCKKEQNSEPLEQILRIRDELQKIHRTSDQSEVMLSRLSDSLGYSIKEVLLQPFSTLLRIIPRIIRDLSQESGKEVDYVVSGADVLVDRRILEILKDPLIHLIRNCIDHGIETPDIRRQQGKEPKGRLAVTVREELDGNIRIEVADDGAGIDTERVVRAAVESGVIRPEMAASMTEEDKQMLIFSSGVTTSRFITDISGRGLGMAIVSTAISEAGGMFWLNSGKGKGTQLAIRLPKTIAAARGLLVREGDQSFLIPVHHIEKAVSIVAGDIETVEGRRVIRLNQETFAVIGLSDILGLRKKTGNQKQAIPGILLHCSGIRFVCTVDTIEDEYEGVVKPLGAFLDGYRNVEGVCVLGSGQMVCVLHVADLVNSAMDFLRRQVSAPSTSVTDSESSDRKRILVAEDSITVRNMIKSYLTASGFEVTTAVDGLEAFEKLGKEVYDLVVSDVEMPGMNGFDLTKKIRSNSSLNRLPVILVTALESADDKRKGLESGANAYIVKSSFEKSNLVDTIHRLI